MLHPARTSLYSHLYTHFNFHIRKTTRQKASVHYMKYPRSQAPIFKRAWERGYTWTASPPWNNKGRSRCYVEIVSEDRVEHMRSRALLPRGVQRHAPLSWVLVLLSFLSEISKLSVVCFPNLVPWSFAKRKSLVFSLTCHTFNIGYASAAQQAYCYNTHNVHRGKYCMLLLWSHDSSGVWPQKMNWRTQIVSRNLGTAPKIPTGICLDTVHDKQSIV